MTRPAHTGQSTGHNASNLRQVGARRSESPELTVHHPGAYSARYGPFRVPTETVKRTQRGAPHSHSSLSLSFSLSVTKISTGKARPIAPPAQTQSQTHRLLSSLFLLPRLIIPYHHHSFAFASISISLSILCSHCSFVTSLVSCGLCVCVESLSLALFLE